MKLNRIGCLLSLSIMAGGCATTKINLKLGNLNPQIVKGSGTAVTKSYDLKDFEAIDLSRALPLEVTQAEAFKVSVTTDDNLLSHFRVTREAKTLRVSCAVSAESRLTKVKVSLPTLKRLNASAASQVVLKQMKSESLDLNVSAASHVSGAVEVNELAVDASAASHVKLDGKARKARLQASAGSRLNLAELEMHTATVNLSAASAAEVDVSEQLDYDVSAASHLSYAGSPKLGRRAVSTASSARPR